MFQATTLREHPRRHSHLQLLQLQRRARRAALRRRCRCRHRQLRVYLLAGSLHCGCHLYPKLCRGVLEGVEAPGEEGNAEG